jgi:hypothetical protein
LDPFAGLPVPPAFADFVGVALPPGDEVTGVVVVPPPVDGLAVRAPVGVCGAAVTGALAELAEGLEPLADVGEPLDAAVVAVVVADARAGVTVRMPGHATTDAATAAAVKTLHARNPVTTTGPALR